MLSPQKKENERKAKKRKRGNREGERKEGKRKKGRMERKKEGKQSINKCKKNWINPAFQPCMLQKPFFTWVKSYKIWHSTPEIFPFTCIHKVHEHSCPSNLWFQFLFPRSRGSHREQAAKGASITQQSGGTIYSEGWLPHVLWRSDPLPLISWPHGSRNQGGCGRGFSQNYT